MLSGNQEKAIATLKRIATENGAPMPLGKLIISRQVSSCSPDPVAAVSPCVQECGHVYMGGARVRVSVGVHGVGVGGAVRKSCKGNLTTPVSLFSLPSPESATCRI